jgi:hypothetical protein
VEVGIRSVSNAKDDTWKDVTWYDRKKSFPAEVCAKLDSVSTPGSRIQPSTLALDYSVPRRRPRRLGGAAVRESSRIRSASCDRHHKCFQSVRQMISRDRRTVFQ